MLFVVFSCLRSLVSLTLLFSHCSEANARKTHKKKHTPLISGCLMVKSPKKTNLNKSDRCTHYVNLHLNGIKIGLTVLFSLSTVPGLRASFHSDQFIKSNETMHAFLIIRFSMFKIGPFSIYSTQVALTYCGVSCVRGLLPGVKRLQEMIHIDSQNKSEWCNPVRWHCWWPRCRCSCGLQPCAKKHGLPKSG